MTQSRPEKNVVQAVQRVLRDPRFRFWKNFAKRFPKGEAYLVGGAVRDIAMGRVTKDFDFVVRSVSVRLLTAFLKRHGRVDLVGKRFGVLKFVPRGWTGEAIDIALPRTDHSFGSGGYKDFDVQSDPRLPIVVDLARRDFTVNAIAVRITHNTQHITLVDPYGGLQDIQKKVLRTVGEPRARFGEDYSRMLRGLRFACQLDFAIEREAWRVMCRCMPRLDGSCRGVFIVPRETIGREFIKAFVANPVIAFDLWRRCGAFSTIVPELLKMERCPQPRAFHTEGDVWRHTILALRALLDPAFRRAFPDMNLGAILIFAVLFHDIGKPKTLRTPEEHGTNRIRFDGHDVVGADMARAIAERLHLSQFPKDDAHYHIDTEMLFWLIRNHMLFRAQTIPVMRATTIEKYFLKDRYRGRLLEALAWCDLRATLAPNGKPTLRVLHMMQKRVRVIEKNLKGTRIEPIVNGTAIMKRFQLQPSPFIGQLLDALREEQLHGRVRTKKQALEFLSTKV
ncbi:HD domain-containing protein [Candidatus Uhrbacteria bacterium]|nr:HD domain-containing protein [Candidatus Uhrbacteria bacterium]